MQDAGCKVGIANFDFRIADLGMQDAGCKIQDARCKENSSESRRLKWNTVIMGEIKQLPGIFP